VSVYADILGPVYSIASQISVKLARAAATSDVVVTGDVVVVVASHWATCIVSGTLKKYLKYSKIVLAWVGLSVAKSHEVELENAQSGFRSEVMLQRDSGSIQTVPSPVYPSGQVQVYDPLLFEHSAFQAHDVVSESAHSSRSVQPVPST